MAQTAAAARRALQGRRQRRRRRRQLRLHIYVARGQCAYWYINAMPASSLSLRRQHPNLMLRIMRTMRLMQIDLLPWRRRYIKLYCAVRIMEPPAAVAIGSRPAKHCAHMVQLIIHDHYHSEVLNGRRQMSQRMMVTIESLERQLREYAREIVIE